MVGDSDFGRQINSDRSFRALVIDDDAQMRRMIMTYLETNDISVAGASNKRDTLKQLATGEFRLAILDLQLGTENGLDLLREIRAISEIPVIIITGHRRHEVDRVVGLELGADDYLTKPFGLSELLARARAVLRRSESSRTAPARDSGALVYHFGGWTLDERAQRLTAPSGEPIDLTKSEYYLLIAFLRSPMKPLSRERLLQATRMHEDVFDRSIDVQILRLRRKLEKNSSAPEFIQTKRGIGYLFSALVKVTKA